MKGWFNARAAKTMVVLSVLLLQPTSFAAVRLGWKAVLTGASTTFSDLTAGSGMIVALKLSSTPQIVSWPEADPSAQTTFAHSGRLLDVAYGDGRFVVGTDGPVLTSTNAIDWTSHVTETADILGTVVFGNGIFLGRGRGISRSTDGINWTVPSQPAVQVSSELFFAGGLFFLSSPRTNFLSADGLTWTAAPSGTRAGLYTIAYGDGKFLAIDKQNQILTSEDGINWRGQGTLDVIRPDVAWGNGCFVAVGGGARAYSRDGISWNTVLSAYTEYEVIFASDTFIAAGFGVVHQSESVMTLKMTSPGALSVYGRPDVRYAIESSDTLGKTGVRWNSQHTFVMPGNNSPYSWIDPRPQASNRFYRILSF